MAQPGRGARPESPTIALTPAPATSPAPARPPVTPASVRASTLLKAAAVEESDSLQCDSDETILGTYAQYAFYSGTKHLYGATSGDVWIKVGPSTGKLQSPYERAVPICSLCYDASGNFAASCDAEGNVSLFEANTVAVARTTLYPNVGGTTPVNYIEFGRHNKAHTSKVGGSVLFGTRLGEPLLWKAWFIGAFGVGKWTSSKVINVGERVTALSCGYP
jgi:hypothetical protein